MTILFAAAGWDAAPWRQALAEALPGHDILVADRDGAWRGPDEALAGVRTVLAWSPKLELLGRLPALELILSLGAGVDHLLALPGLPDVPIARIVDPDLTNRMSEYVVWRVLDHHRQGDAYRRAQAERRWVELDQPAASAVTVGILGLGVLGRDAAEKLTALGFRVSGWSRVEKRVAGVRAFFGQDQLDAFLARTDILVALLPLTEETRGFIDRNLLAKLRRDGPLGGPVLVNAGRGGSQIEADIAAALADGTLRAASLDVFETEPLPEDSPLWSAPNLTITPHAAAASDPVALSRGIAAQILAHERGEKLDNLVDRRAGY